MIKPDDISYVAAGYAPLTARLVEFIGMHGFNSSIMEAMKLLPGPFLAVTQQAQPEELVDALSRYFSFVSLCYESNTFAFPQK